MSDAPDSPFDTAVALASAVRDAGGRALLVGGCVRDWLWQQGRVKQDLAFGDIHAKDIDVEVFGLPVERLAPVLARFGPVNAVGESFAVFKIAGLDVALPRRESKTGRGHRGFRVDGDPTMPPEEAARRRDFTVNAIAWDPLSGEWIDPFGGRADLGRRVLRAVDPATFGDDSLRVLRGVQLAARFQLAMDLQTRALCRALPLDDLAAERVWGELEKLLLLAARPSGGLALAAELGVLAQWMPECLPLVRCPQEAEWHPEGDVWTHTLQVVDEARLRVDDLPRPKQVAVMLGAIAHDFGKPATTAFSDGRIRSIGHEEAGVAPTHRMLDRLLVHTMDGYDVRAQVVGLVAHHLKPGTWHKSTTPVGDGAFRRLAQKVDLELLARLAEADCVGRRPGVFDCSAMTWFLGRARALGVEHAPPRPLLLGRHLLPLGVAPGPAMGQLLKRVYERQLDGEVTTLEEALQSAREWLSASPASPVSP
jgi:tRNA nucleotidyltransferase (CCA-adding enzyme)